MDKGSGYQGEDVNNKSLNPCKRDIVVIRHQIPKGNYKEMNSNQIGEFNNLILEVRE